MNRTTILLLCLGIVAVATGMLFFVGNLSAQQQPQSQGRTLSTADNPHLARAADARTSTAKSGQAKELDPKDRDFLSKAAAGGMMEVEMGQMALEKGKSAEVKKIGQTIVNDHTRANSELKALAEKKGLNIGKPKQTPRLGGGDFDTAFLGQMVADHKEDISIFETEAKGGVDPELKAFANRTLPVLKRHLSMAKQAWDKTGKATKKGTEE